MVDPLIKNPNMAIRRRFGLSQFYLYSMQYRFRPLLRTGTLLLGARVHERLQFADAPQSFAAPALALAVQAEARGHGTLRDVVNFRRNAEKKVGFQSFLRYYWLK